ncbi:MULTISPECIES: hypothetical protein [unclassified Paenibacillus]|uniref:hypothetical protein n=1 Tax=unclassified Paenibacillus TaxID=185978 RepID=UPI0003E221FE|nr:MULTISPECIES: hypothetical protein [unclassified Paenibacillus]ETT47945.1 hypothetical protein C162_16785 [Paenibacillus sp. FSL R7-269]OMF94891.1 hypothetical protein BK147_16050 [Paenibacillus sp. FSL R7-0337]
MRDRNKDGRYRKKRDDTKIETIEKTYGVDLDVRGDMELGTYRKLNGGKSLTEIIEKGRQK